MMNRVALVGGGPSRHQVVQYKEQYPDAKVWVIPIAAPEHTGIADLAFELHTYKDIRGVGHYMYVDDLKKLQCPVFMQEVHPTFPTARAFPVAELVKKYGLRFTSTVAYMLAWAMEEGATHISMFGMDMDTEKYKKQKPTCEYFIGMARGKGIEVEIAAGSALLVDEPLYGYES